MVVACKGQADRCTAPPATNSRSSALHCASTVLCWCVTKNEKVFFTDAKSAQTYGKTTVNIVNFCHHYYLDPDRFCLSHSEWHRAAVRRRWSFLQPKVQSDNTVNLVHAKNPSRTRYTRYKFHTLSCSLRRSLHRILDCQEPVCRQRQSNAGSLSIHM